MSFRRSVLAVLFSTVTLSTVASAELTQNTPGRFKIDATATPVVGPTISFDGKGGPVEVTVDANSYTFTANLKSLDMGERTEHAKKDFGCDKHSKGVLVVDKSAVKVPGKDKESTEGTVTGKFKYHGAERDVKVQYRAKREGSHVSIKGNFSFDYTQFNVPKICRFKGSICVDPTVKVAVFGLKLQDK